jgi:hypothetical protein
MERDCDRKYANKHTNNDCRIVLHICIRNCSGTVLCPFAQGKRLKSNEY